MSSHKAGVTGVAERYATALYELAEDRGALDQVSADLRSLKAMLDESGDLRRVIASPVIGRDDQRKALTALAEKAGFHEIVRNFLGVVAAKHRSFAVPGMIGAFLERLAARRGEVTARIVSATALTSAQKSALTTALNKATGNTVTIDASVDPALLGGMVVRVGSRMVDSSLSTKLKRLQLAMKGVG
ncbi:F0F1 ATP synthase subunit delta [Rhodospirillum rubrum]|uniref:ATP synthase subunit delta n=2 Tax=Rhodospirillum rubrum TaxID=1085 RepID=ATPD_RHORT|nr:F0F1 ATP synthase subunit delta [Rhodospirillum rubrum]P05438.2 RecName: Full=ATP synthase subunit delta; AltName: Full=ATP synthase F(1) sector subunit delta; AltName: Full=F-type ATPase subunit delta; Short=F-ATPase subunit delta [Rhodospirillum rubrum]Q2RV21.1 RecName: Full=ATP synthase subunit delta; AltName: Full=ATP synthase F(1) sector subunit delta; AltName: Full=F-type ATPase subunit delta; Short=F-ATPase subunit delta [Rhodospirillum rubrum ATCC 11170]ABC22024.1 H+-transporting two-